MIYLSTSDLLAALQAIENAVPGAVTRNPKAGLRKSIDFLSQHNGMTVASLIQSLEESAAATAPKKKIKSEPLREDTVAAHVTELRRSQMSSVDAFERAMDTLRKDKKVRVLELKQICKEYTGDTSTVKSKADAIARIQQAFEYRWKLEHR